jgi:HYDIN/CFA65/VesB-like, Ig-like domain
VARHARLGYVRLADARWRCSDLFWRWTPAQTAEFRNTGNAALTITQVEVVDDAADFVVTDLTPGITTLRPNGEKGFQIRFRPTAAGNRQASLRIHSDAAGSPHSLTLLGVGFAPA